MDCCPTSQPLLSFEQALNNLLSSVSTLLPKETITLAEANKRVLAEHIYSPLNVPPFNNSAMDGYGIRFSDWQINKPFNIVGHVLAGQSYDTPLQPQQCVRIMTGAAIPDGVDTVVMQEMADVNENSVIFNHNVKKGQNIRLIGEDIKQGSRILAQGRQLGVAELPIIASLGINEIAVYRRLKVAIFSTGDELISVGSALNNGQIYDTNRFTLKLMLEKLGCQVIDFGIIPDNEQLIRQTIQQADQQADVVISSGGVSVGDADYIKKILSEQGQIYFWKLAMKPGKPFAFGKLTNAWFCGLPGNPVSATVTFYQLVQPFLIKLSGNSQWQRPPQFKAKTITPLKKTPGRTDFQRGKLSINENGEWQVNSVGQQGSHIFSSFSLADCFIILERERGPVQINELVTVEPFNALLKV